MSVIKCWCENTKEGQSYLRYNGYQFPVRMGLSRFWFVLKKGRPLIDVTVVWAK